MSMIINDIDLPEHEPNLEGESYSNSKGNRKVKKPKVLPAQIDQHRNQEEKR